jgi:hypothetical protein
MPANNRRIRGRIWIACAPVLLALMACGSSASDSTPTPGLEALYTVAYQTFSAQVATELALTPPTDTPPPSVTPTASEAARSTARAGGGIGCDNAAFVYDVTIPDGSVIPAGAPFVKTWMLKNTGSCAWSPAYKLSYQSGEQMGGTDVSLTLPVQPGQQVPVSVNLVAPATPGTYKGIWRMHNDKAQAFGDAPYVAIDVMACRRSSKTRVTIAGHAGPEKATIDFGSGTVVTDAHGDYSFSVPSGWSGTVIPSKAKVHPWTFDPPQRAYFNVACDLLHEDFQATAPPGT